MLTQDEIRQMLAHLNRIELLLTQILYGGGLRLKKCIRLKVHNVDFNRDCIRVFGKGYKERETLLPSATKKRLKNHLVDIKKLFEIDRQHETPAVELPLPSFFPSAFKRARPFFVRCEIRSRSISAVIANELT